MHTRMVDDEAVNYVYLSYIDFLIIERKQTPNNQYRSGIF